MTDVVDADRVFKTRWFAKAARKASIADAELCDAIAEVRRGQADDLGGGVFKKRLNRNMHRSILLAHAGRFWVYAYLFAKKDRDNIGQDELMAFRRLAGLYAVKPDADVETELAAGVLLEICNER